MPTKLTRHQALANLKKLEDRDRTSATGFADYQQIKSFNTKIVNLVNFVRLNCRVRKDSGKN